jgi:LysR family glycine cleavage system transcriptional activator
VNNAKLPPLKALRAFESAARHLSFSRAAEELFVTPGAVSQQVRLLEDFLGKQLFKRMHRRILLTDEGQCLLPGIQDGFSRFGDALEDVKSMDSSRPVTISAAPSFASKWLVPRLRHLREMHPEIEIRIDTSIEVVDLARSDIDIGIRFGGGNYPGLQVDLLIREEIYPVCSPGLIGDHPLNHPSDLEHYELLHYGPGTFDMGPGWADWQMWLMASGATNVDFTRGMIFDRQEMLIQATLDLQGVALVGSVSVTDDIESGRLIKPFELTFPLDFAYYFVTTPSKAQWPKIAAIREWILKEAKISDEHRPR